MSPGSLSRLFAELKRRRVFRVMAVYGATAFVILQAADVLAQGLGLPDVALRLTTFLVLVGFPIAVVLAWAFETTPEGVRRTEAARPEEISEILAQPASKRWPAGLLALAGVALLFGAWWMGRTGALPDLNLSPPAAEASEGRRIAVLPFADLGGNAEDDPFLAGIHVDIHGKLAGLADLRVTSLGSVGDYAASQKSTAQIADELVVDYLLRGSVRRAGDQVRVNVQLTDVANREDIWLQDFDREVTAENLFAIQSEIARRVATSLEAALSPADLAQLDANLSTNNLEAINAYHRARGALFNRNYQRPFEGVVEHIETALQLEPEFVEAWSMLAWALSLQSQGDLGLAPRALEAVRRIESLAPGTLEATKARGWYTYYVERDYERALRLMLDAERSAPSDTDVLMGIAFLRHRLGEFSEGTRTMKRAVDLDPQNATTLAELGHLLGRSARWDAAREVLERALAIDPSQPRARAELVHQTAQAGDPAGALSLAAEFGLEPDYHRAWYAMLVGDYDRAARTLGEIRTDTTSLGLPARMNTLAAAIWVETVRGGDPLPIQDSLAALLDEEEPDVYLPFYRLWKAMAHLAVDQPVEGWKLWEEVVRDARASDDRAGPIGDRWLAARIAAVYGRSDEALALLEEAVGRPAAGLWSVADLELDPRFDSLRSDPRFDELIERQRAYEEEQARLAEEEGPWLP